MESQGKIGRSRLLEHWPVNGHAACSCILCTGFAVAVPIHRTLRTMAGESGTDGDQASVLLIMTMGWGMGTTLGTAYPTSPNLFHSVSSAPDDGICCSPSHFLPASVDFSSGPTIGATFSNPCETYGSSFPLCGEGELLDHRQD